MLVGGVLRAVSLSSATCHVTVQAGHSLADDLWATSPLRLPYRVLYVSGY